MFISHCWVSCELVPTAYWMSCYRPSEQRRTKQKLSWDMQSFTVSLSLIRRYSPWFIDSADVADSLLKAGLLKTPLFYEISEQGVVTRLRRPWPRWTGQWQGSDITQCNSTLKIVPVASACVPQPIRGQHSGHVIPVDQSEARTMELRFPITAELLSHSITLKIIRVTPQNINTHIKSFAEEDGRTVGLPICSFIHWSYIFDTYFFHEYLLNNTYST